MTGKNHLQKQYIRCFFGSNSFETRGKEERRRYFSYGYGHSLLQRNGVSLPDGSTLVFGHAPSGARCDNGFGIYLEKKGPDGKVEKRISFLIPLSLPQARPVGDCEGAPPGSSVVLTAVGNASVSDAVILADGTILVSGGYRLYPFVIRFDRDLNTKFDSNRILIVDYTDIEALERKSNNYQELADLVHEYVTRKLQEDK